MTSPAPVYTAQGEQVALGRPVGEGVRATVYLVRHRPDQVAWLRRPPPEPDEARKLEAMVTLYHPDLEAAAVWPVNTLYDLGGAYAGYQRPFVNLGDFRELPHLTSPALRRAAFPRADWAFLARVAAGVAGAFAALHATGQVMGDVNSRNVLVSAHGRVRLVNVDTYQFRTEREVFRTPVTSEAYLPPELQGCDLSDTDRTEQHDLFGLAVLLFLLLSGGHHPYSARTGPDGVLTPGRAIATHRYAYGVNAPPDLLPPPESLPRTALPRDLQALFELAFHPGGATRPDARTWAAALTAFAGTLVPCEADPTHAHEPGRPCPWCELDRVRQVSPFMLELLRPAVPELPDAVQTAWQAVIQVPPPARTPGPETPPTAAPTEFPLDLPPRPNAVTEASRERAVRWVLRAAALLLLMAGTVAVQHSILAALILPALLVLAFTVGRRMSVDWDAMIDGYQNWEGRLVERLMPARGRWTAYHEAIGTRRAAVQADLTDLRRRQDDLHARLERENAHAEYTRAFAALEDQRRALLQGQNRPRQAAEALLMQRRERAIADFLKRQPLREHLLPHLTTRMVLQLNTQGVRSAHDLHGPKLDGVQDGWRAPLLLWRQELEDFVPVGADLVPPQDVREVQLAQGEQLRAALTQFQERAAQFLTARWGQAQGALHAELTDVTAQIAARQRALKTLDTLARQG